MSSAALLALLVSLVYGEGAETVFEKEAAQHSRRGSVAQQAEPRDTFSPEGCRFDLCRSLHQFACVCSSTVEQRSQSAVEASFFPPIQYGHISHGCGSESRHTRQWQPEKF